MTTDFEKPYWQAYSRIAGIDEAGRGCLAGAVVAAAVVFERQFKPTGVLKEVNDSKQLSPKQREELADAIKQSAKSFALAQVEPNQIDQINILQAAILAMNLAVEKLAPPPDLLLIDGNRFKPSAPIPFETVVKGDARVFSIAAASILAKVYRDNLMRDIDAAYPQYGFARNFGYPVPQHIEAIRRYGRTPIHRYAFKLKQLGEKET